MIITDAGTSSSSTFEGLLDRVLNSAALASLYLVFTPESSRNMLQPAIPPHEWLREVGSWRGQRDKRATLQSACQRTTTRRGRVPSRKQLFCCVKTRTVRTNQQTSSESEPQGEAEEEQEQELEQEQEQWSTAPHYPVTLSDMSATSPPNLESTRVIKHGRGNRMLFSR